MFRKHDRHKYDLLCTDAMMSGGDFSVFGKRIIKYVYEWKRHDAVACRKPRGLVVAAN